MKSVTIGIVTYNTLFYNKLAFKKIIEHTHDCEYEIVVYDNGSTDGSRDFWSSLPNVRLFNAASTNDRSHGAALNFLIKQAKYPIFCALDADAFPVSDEWMVPADALNDRVVVAGIERGWGYTLENYVHPSYLFGKVNFLKRHSFEHQWPNVGDKFDTGEKITQKAYKYGYDVKMWKKRHVDFDGRFRGKPCDYAGLVWHVWWSSRKITNPGLYGVEFEPDYHSFCKEHFRKKYDLDF